MAKTRENSSGTAMILVVSGVIALIVGLWLVGRNEKPDAPPTATPPAAENSDRDAGERTEILPTPASVDVRSELTETRVADAERAESGPRDASIRVVVRLAASHEPANVDVVVARRDDDREVTSVRLPVKGGTAESLLTVPPGVWVWVRALVDGAYGDTKLARLIPGESHEIELYCAAHPTRLRITGPSPELLPLLRVEIVESPAGGKRRQFHLPFGPTGTATCLLDHPSRASVQLFDDQRTPLIADGRSFFEPGIDVILTPNERLHGFVIRHRGEPILADLWLDQREATGRHRSTFATTRAIANASEQIRCDLGEPVNGTAAARARLFRTASDVWTIDVDKLEVLGLIVVQFAPPNAGDYQAIPDLVAIRIDDQQRFTGPADGEAKDIEVPAGHYRLAWVGNDGVDRPALDLVEVRPNAETEVIVVPRSMERWTIHVPGTEALASQLDGAALEWPVGQPFGVLRAGKVMGYSEIAPRPGEAATFFLPGQAQGFRAQFRNVDRAGHVAELAAELARSLPVRLNITALPGQHGPRIRVASKWEPGQFSQVALGRLRVAPSQPARGFVSQVTGAFGEQVLDWFEATAENPIVEVAAGGHWARVTCPTGLESVNVHLESDLGEAHTRIFPQDGRAELHVPPRTTAIHLIAHGARQSFTPQLREIILR